MSNSKYQERFLELVKCLKHLGTRLGKEDTKVMPILQTIAFDPINPTNAELVQARKIASERYFAIMMIRHSDKKRYGSIMANLANNHTWGTDRYPRTIADTYKYLVDFQGSSTTIISSDKTGMAFYTSNNGGGRGRGGRGRAGGRGRGD
eukprot:5188854-Ditylum_brightwellii.AAC.1